MSKKMILLVLTLFVAITLIACNEDIHQATHNEIDSDRRYEVYLTEGEYTRIIMNDLHDPYELQAKLEFEVEGTTDITISLVIETNLHITPMSTKTFKADESVIVQMRGVDYIVLDIKVVEGDHTALKAVNLISTIILV